MRLLRSLLAYLASLLRWLSPARPPHVRRLARRRVSAPVLCFFAEHDDLDGAWRACGRADFLLEVALRAEVEPARVRAGLEEVLRAVARWPGSQPEDLADAREAVAAWAAGTLGAGALLDRLDPVLRAAVDADPAVAEALAEVKEAQRWAQRDRAAALADEYDRRHRNSQARIAASFRDVVTTEAVRFALEGLARHPYR